MTTAENASAFIFIAQHDHQYREGKQQEQQRGRNCH